MNELQEAVFAQLASFLANHDHHIVEDEHGLPRSSPYMLLMEIEGISVMFAQEREHFLIRIGSPSNLNERGFPEWPLVKLVDALNWGTLTGGLTLEDQCALLASYFTKVREAFTLQHYPATNLAMHQYGMQAN